MFSLQLLQGKRQQTNIKEQQNKWILGNLRFNFSVNTQMCSSNKCDVSLHISWGCVAVCLAQFVSQSGPLVYCAAFLICSAPPNASDQWRIHRSIIIYCMWMSWEMSLSPFISLEKKSLLKVIWAQAERSSFVWGWRCARQGIVLVHWHEWIARVMWRLVIVE